MGHGHSHSHVAFKHADGVLPLKANLDFKKQRKLQPRNIDCFTQPFFDLDQAWN